MTKKKNVPKKAGLVYHLLTLWKFTQRAFPFYTLQIHKNTILSFKKAYPRFSF